MYRMMLILVCVGFLGLTGCKSAQQREADAKAEIAEERAKIMKKYTECLEKHEESGDADKKCAQYKEAAGAVLPSQ